MNPTILQLQQLAKQIITNKELCHVKQSPSNIYDIEITVKDNDSIEIFDVVYSPQTDADYWVFYNGGLVFRCDDLETVMKFINMKRPEKKGNWYDFIIN